MTRLELVQQIRKKKSYLCIGLDTDIEKIPKHLRDHPDAVFEFNKQIIDATSDLCVAYKLNTAFYEAMGSKGWEILERTADYIQLEHFMIADAKRGDIGNTSTQYAKAFFDNMGFDAVTVAPYMGEDSVKPFLDFMHKWAIILALTSNAGSKDFQQLKLSESDQSLFEKVLEETSKWGNIENTMYVVGATKAMQLAETRKIIPDHFLLVPGVGFQGGSLAEVSKYGMNKDVGLLVNVSRAVIYASEKEDFAKEARAIALQYQQEMERLMS